MKSGDLIKHKKNGDLATIVEMWTRLWRDSDDWEAARHGYDCGTAETAIRVVWHRSGREVTYRRREIRKNFEIIAQSNCLKA